MSDDTITTEQVQQLLTRGPYHQWLGLQVLKVERDAIEIKATWREEWVVNPDKRYTHGGILAAPRGSGQPHGPGRAHDRYASRLSPRGEAGRSGRQGPCGEVRRTILGFRSRGVRPGRRARGERTRRVSHRAAQGLGSNRAIPRLHRLDRPERILTRRAPSTRLQK